MRYTKPTDYKDYLKQQITRAESKWARKFGYNEIFKKNLNRAWAEVRDEIGNVQSICCMGSRDGTEVFEFKQYYPKAEVHGVDITKNIYKIKTHLQVNFHLKDFNDLPKAWDNKFDLIFSNSLDHAFKPQVTINEWHRVCRGFLFLELSTTRDNNIEHKFSVDDDLFPKELFEMVKTWETPERNIFTVLLKVIK